MLRMITTLCLRLNFGKGIFLDLDLHCYRPLTPLRKFEFVAPAAYPAGISNGFIMTKPGLPFMKRLIDNLPNCDLSWFSLPYLTVSFSTGCHYLSWVTATFCTARIGKLTHSFVPAPSTQPRRSTERTSVFSGVLTISISSTAMLPHPYSTT